MPNNFQDWTSLLANICTIIAFLFAIVIWREWKAQENYSFIRDNIFELELKSAYSYITMIQLMTCYFNYCYEKINGNNSEMEKHLKEYEEYYTKWLEDNFIFKANYIVVSNLLYNKFFKINHEDFRRLDVDLIGKINDLKLSNHISKTC
jgi:hypothetical protein